MVRWMIDHRCEMLHKKNGLPKKTVLPLVGARGFEPPASASRTLRSTRLSHAPIHQRMLASQHTLITVVPKVGVEPTRACTQRFLRPPRLPFRHFG